MVHIIKLIEAMIFGRLKVRRICGRCGSLIVMAIAKYGIFYVFYTLEMYEMASTNFARAISNNAPHRNSVSNARVSVLLCFMFVYSAAHAHRVSLICAKGARRSTENTQAAICGAVITFQGQFFDYGVGLRHSTPDKDYTTTPKKSQSTVTHAYALHIPYDDSDGAQAHAEVWYERAFKTCICCFLAIWNRKKLLRPVNERCN